MFNRNNYSSPFGPRTDSNRPPAPARGGYSNPDQEPQLPPRQGGQDTRMSGGYDDPRGQSTHHSSSGIQRAPVGRQAGGPRGGGGRTWNLRPAKSPADQYTFGNLYVT